MSIRLTPSDRALLQGSRGEGTALAMRVVVRMAEIVGAQSLLDVEMAHIDSALFQGDATLEFAERLADSGAKVAVPSTLNVAGVDVHGWQEWSVPETHASKARRQMQAYERMGCAPTWTCAPYQTEVRPGPGQQVAWGESSAIVFANSVLGARTERYPDLLDICCAITGRAPAAGLHLAENRVGGVVFDFSRIPLKLQDTPEFTAVVGHWIGRAAGDRVPVLSGLTLDPTEDQLKTMGAAMASSGAVALFHWVGITPEAPDLSSAIGGSQEVASVHVTPEDLAGARRELTTTRSDSLDLVVLGSPHFSVTEFRDLAPLLEGHRCSPTVRFVVTCGRGVKMIAEAAGLIDGVRRFGGELTVDTCILTSPMLDGDVASLMTNSPKFAYYSPSLLGTSVAFGSLEECVESAVAGRVVRQPSPWDSVDPNSLAGAVPGDVKAGSGGKLRLSEAPQVSDRLSAAVGPDSWVVVTGEPLSFWGGFDPETGKIIERGHALAGMTVADTVLMLPGTRGSSTTTAVVLEAVRRGTAPAAFVTRGTDAFLELASVVAEEMYDSAPPVVSVGKNEFDRFLGAVTRHDS